MLLCWYISVRVLQLTSPRQERSLDMPAIRQQQSAWSVTACPLVYAVIAYQALNSFLQVLLEVPHSFDAVCSAAQLVVHNNKAP